MKTICRWLCVLVVLIPAVTVAEIVDIRKPKYQALLMKLSNAQQALAVAERELRKARSLDVMPQVDFKRMIVIIRLMQDDLNVLLAPEKNRIQYQILRPNPLFFYRRQQKVLHPLRYKQQGSDVITLPSHRQHTH